MSVIFAAFYIVFLHVFESFSALTSSYEVSRKRAIGLPLSFPISRKLVTGRWAATAGTQLRRTATLPLDPFEVEPGEAIRIFGHAVHPSVSCCC